MSCPETALARTAEYRAIGHRVPYPWSRGDGERLRVVAFGFSAQTALIGAGQRLLTVCIYCISTLNSIG